MAQARRIRRKEMLGELLPFYLLKIFECQHHAATVRSDSRSDVGQTMIHRGLRHYILRREIHGDPGSIRVNQSLLITRSRGIPNAY
jgi:hypothetical protein